MKEIVKVLLQEGIDEGIIHEVLSVISPSNTIFVRALVEEMINEIKDEDVLKMLDKRRKLWDDAVDNRDKLKKRSNNKQAQYDAEDKAAELGKKSIDAVDHFYRWKAAKMSGKIKDHQDGQENK